MSQYGHFGQPSIRLAAGSFAALLAHFLIPYGVVTFRGPAAPGADWLSRGTVMEMRRALGSDMLSSNASPDVVLAGLILATVGGGLLLFLGFQPLQVSQARWVGAVCSVLAAIGLSMAFMASMYSVGTGFASFLMTLFPTDYRAYFWPVSALLVAVGSGYLLVQAMLVARKMVSTADGLRDEVDDELRHAGAGLVLIGIVLLVPWSIGLLPDGVSDDLGTNLPYDDNAAFWFSAEDVQSATPAESHPNGRIRNLGDSFSILSASIHVMLACGWVAVAAGLLRVLAGTLVSTGGPHVLLIASRFAHLATLGLIAASAVMYVLAWIFIRPDPDALYTYLPGFFPILVLAPLLWLARRLVGTMSDVMRPAGTGA